MNSKFVSVFLSFATAIYNLFFFLCSWTQHFRWPLVKSIFFSIERMRIWNCLCAINNHNKPIYLVNLPLVCIFLRTPTIVENWPIFFLLSLSCQYLNQNDSVRSGWTPKSVYFYKQYNFPIIKLILPSIFMGKMVCILKLDNFDKIKLR